MAIYAIGDVQGCYDQLRRLLDLIDFDENKDSLWFTGDLVNRGKQSLKTLRFIKKLPKKSRLVVLGNHDLHLIAVYAGCTKKRKKDTFDKVLKAKDSEELISWLRQCKLLHYNKKSNYLLVHAGLAPQWDLATAKSCALEVETVLKDDEQHYEFLENMYGDFPNRWQRKLRGIERLRFITNCLTRMRFCNAKGEIDLQAKGPIGSQHKSYYPWFNAPKRKTKEINIVFGHWASLQGISYHPHAFAIDTGCVWGGYLTAMNLKTKARYQVPST